MKNKSSIIVKTILLIGVALTVVALVVMLTMTPAPKTKANRSKEIGIENENFDIGGDFVLTDVNGVKVDSRNMRDKILLIYFGFTYCPDICPASLSEMTRALEELKNNPDKVQPIFVTIDPNRDSPKQLKEYFGNFDSRIMALTGTQDEIDSVAKSFRVYYSKAIDGKENTEHYLLNHSSFYYLVGKDGKLIKYYAPGTSGVDMGLDIKKYIQEH